MEETDVWATLEQENSVIFHDNDFEIFVDCEGSNHNYKEFEINGENAAFHCIVDPLFHFHHDSSTLSSAPSLQRLGPRGLFFSTSPMMMEAARIVKELIQ